MIKCPKCQKETYCGCSNCKNETPLEFQRKFTPDGEFVQCPHCKEVFSPDEWLESEISFKLFNNKVESMSQLVEQINLTGMTMEELVALKTRIEETLVKMGTPHVLMDLSYNTFKGSGKCWVAEIDKETLEIQSFLTQVSVQKRDSYSGTKRFKIPLIEGKTYQIRESGSKKTDSNYYKIVQNGKLEEFDTSSK